MAELARAYIGSNSNGKQRYYTSDNDPDALAMKQKLYLKDNVVVNPTNYNKQENKSKRDNKLVWIRAVQLEESSSKIILLGQKK